MDLSAPASFSRVECALFMWKIPGETNIQGETNPGLLAVLAEPPSKFDQSPQLAKDYLR